MATDEQPELCPNCGTALVLDPETNQWDCPNGDYDPAKIDWGLDDEDDDEALDED